MVERIKPGDPNNQPVDQPQADQDQWSQFLRENEWVRGINCPDERIIETRRVVDLHAAGKFDAVIITSENGQERGFRYIGEISSRRGKNTAIAEFTRDAFAESPSTLVISSLPASAEAVKDAVRLIEDPRRLQFMPGVVVDQATFQEGFKSTTKNLIEDVVEITFFEEMFGEPLVYEEIDAVQLGGVVFLDKKKARGKIGVWEELETDGEGRFRFFRRLPDDPKVEDEIAHDCLSEAAQPEVVTPEVPQEIAAQTSQVTQTETPSKTNGETILDEHDEDDSTIEDKAKQPKDAEFTVEPGVYRFSIKDMGWQGEMQGGITKIDEPGISFEDIGGLSELKDNLRLLVAGLGNPDLFSKWGTRPPQGILLYGTPGTGKTMVAKALAHEAGVPFFSLGFSDMASRWVHQSAETVRAILKTLDRIDGKKIVFIDEFDNVAPSRAKLPDNPTGGSARSAREILSPLLEYMDGFRSSGNTIFVAATNRKDDVDEAMLRPGRFDRQYHIRLPQGTELIDVYRVHVAKSEKEAGRNLFADIDYDTLMKLSKGFSGADIAEVVRRVLENKVAAELRGEDQGAVTTDNLVEELKRYEIRKREAQMGFRPKTE